jgi:hypothetical protein
MKTEGNNLNILYGSSINQRLTITDPISNASMFCSGKGDECLEKPVNKFILVFCYDNLRITTALNTNLDCLTVKLFHNCISPEKTFPFISTLTFLREESNPQINLQSTPAID